MMEIKRLAGAGALATMLVVLGVASSSAQVTTGTVLGTVVDQQGGAIPGATVVLVSDSQGTKSAPVVTGTTGDFLVPNVRPDTYTIESHDAVIQDVEPVRRHRSVPARGRCSAS